MKGLHSKHQLSFKLGEVHLVSVFLNRVLFCCCTVLDINMKWGFSKCDLCVCDLCARDSCACYLYACDSCVCDLCVCDLCV